jgi:serine/threonine protein kinase
MASVNFIGQTLDGKYKIERELGRGGMGAVYLALHVGTERPVALKIIAPQFMERVEFIERFRREARAAGRLRHPNVVNVTDFGFAETANGKVAYLVMEYLDGVTLGEVLEEEKRLPLEWTLDILEQVCSAVQEAHAQGIIHRDLKPDNIWLEPNQRGGYTVKVLDFGIAKLEEGMSPDVENLALPASTSTPTQQFQHATVADSPQPNTIVEKQSATAVSEAPTIAQTEPGTFLPSNNDDTEAKTAILTGDENKTDRIDKNAETRVISEQIQTDQSLLKSPTTSDLTRVGAVLGTPLYMSPEQCRGERLTPSSDIYSLGVIAYQMLSGDTPFAGDFKTVMESHKEVEPPPLIVGKVSGKVRKVIHSALSKNPEERPQTAEAFANRIRSESQGIGTLLRRSLVIYSEHLPKFIGLTTFFLLPVVFLTMTMIALSFVKVSEIIDSGSANLLIGINSLLLSVFTTYCTYLIIGTTTWIVAQHLAVPLRRLHVRPALKAAKKKWKAFAWTGILYTIIGFVTCGIGFLVGSVIWSLFAPVVMLENLSGWKALQRSFALVKRSLLTTFAAIFLMFIVPAIISGCIWAVVNITGKAIENKRAETAVSTPPDQTSATPGASTEKKEPQFSLNLGGGQNIKINRDGKDMQSRLIDTFLASIIQIFWLPMHIFVASFTSIIIALLYLKTRQSGGESMTELLEQFEEAERPQSNWQKRVRERLIQSGRITSKA